jgi:hypothetical protein
MKDWEQQRSIGASDARICAIKDFEAIRSVQKAKASHTPMARLFFPFAATPSGNPNSRNPQPCPVPLYPLPFPVPSGPTLGPFPYCETSLSKPEKVNIRPMP